jgi:hypothetical protein
MRLDSLNQKVKIRVCFWLLPLLIVLGTTACGNTDDPTATSSNQTLVATAPGDSASDLNISNGYPASEANQGYPAVQDPGYPAPNLYENLSDEPPNPTVQLPPSNQDKGVIGGILIREVVDYGFEPLTPASLSLADVLLNTDGQPAFVRAGTDSQKAQLFPTGVFIFQDVPPGEYGLMVDVGYTQFPITGDDGTPLLITVEPGSVIEMGQVITQLPAQ